MTKSKLIGLALIVFSLELLWLLPQPVPTTLRSGLLVSLAHASQGNGSAYERNDQRQTGYPRFFPVAFLPEWGWIPLIVLSAWLINASIIRCCITHQGNIASILTAILGLAMGTIAVFLW